MTGSHNLTLDNGIGLGGLWKNMQVNGLVHRKAVKTNNNRRHRSKGGNG